MKKEKLSRLCKPKPCELFTSDVCQKRLTRTSSSGETRAGILGALNPGGSGLEAGQSGGILTLPVLRTCAVGPLCLLLLRPGLSSTARSISKCQQA